MLLFVPRETIPEETRVPMTPSAVRRLLRQGIVLRVEAGIGEACGFSDSDYQEAGAEVVRDRKASIREADMILRLHPPSLDEVKLMKAESVHVSFLDPFSNLELVDAFLKSQVSAVSMEMIPRTTLAQKMDALSSQANLAGYAAVILAAARLRKVLPMMMTPAGTLPPARVFVIGAGVAGLQAIATAVRLGARVEAFDTRPVVEEQVQSLGARFVQVDLGETGQTDDGYAKELTPAQQELQRQAMAKVCAQSDIVITTAQLFGRKAPLIITKDMIRRMQPGSVIVDLAAESGGNVEGSQLNKELVVNGVVLVSLGNLPRRVALHASEMYAANLANFVLHFWDEEDQAFLLDLDDEIIRGCLVADRGELQNEMVAEQYKNRAKQRSKKRSAGARAKGGARKKPPAKKQKVARAKAPSGSREKKAETKGAGEAPRETTEPSPGPEPDEEGRAREHAGPNGDDLEE